MSADPTEAAGSSGEAWLQLSGPPRLLSPQRAIRVRSHSMETMVTSQKKPHAGGLPGSLSGGISHNSVEVTKTTFSVSVCRPWVPQAVVGGGVCSPRFGPGDQQGELDDGEGD